MHFYAPKIYSENYSEQVVGLIYFRRLVSCSQPPCMEILNSGALPRVVELLDRQRHMPKLGFECLWVLTNLVKMLPPFVVTAVCPTSLTATMLRIRLLSVV